MKRAILITAFALVALCVRADGAHRHRGKSGGSSRLVGQVVSADGRPAGHARVRIRHSGKRHRHRIRAHVNAAGHFSVAVATGTYRIRASRHGMGTGHAVANAPGSVVIRLSGHGRHIVLPYERHQLGVHVRGERHSSHHAHDAKAAHSGTAAKPASAGKSGPPKGGAGRGKP